MTEDKADNVEVKVCPECGQRFMGNGWDGVDAHWRSKHENILRYKQVRLQLKPEKYTAKPS